MDLSEYAALRARQEAATDQALKAMLAANALRDAANALCKEEFAARLDVLVAEKAVIRSRMTIAANKGDTSEIDAELAVYADALGRYSAQIERMSFADAMAAARGGN